MSPTKLDMRVSKFDETETGGLRNRVSYYYRSVFRLRVIRRSEGRYSLTSFVSQLNEGFIRCWVDG